VLKSVQVALWIIVVVAAGALGFLVVDNQRQHAHLLGAPGQNTAVQGMGPPVATVGGPFVLTDEDGRRFDSRSIAGQPYAVFFGFTHCPDVCPTSMLEISTILRDAGAVAQDFRVYFITVDPERDTPELLKAYTDSFDARIIGLTGTTEEIATVARAYRAFYRRVPTGGDSYTMDHTASIYLMDGQARFVGTIAYQEEHATAVAKLRRLIGSR
jgi:protein SCO1